MDKEDGVYIYTYVCVCVCVYVYIDTMWYYSAISKNEIMPFAATCMNLEIITLSEVSQKENNKHYIMSLICEI